ncbi:MAG TPA: type II secretion system protein GspM [Bryobacteraceae bacterium]|jgi:thymidine phosphorylase
MTITTRERRSLSFLGVSLALSGIWALWQNSGTSTVVVVAPTDSTALAEKRLAKLRDTAATVPAKEEILKSVAAELAKREAGLIPGETAAQAQAELLTILHRLCAAQQIEIKSTEPAAIAPLGDAYGAATVAINIECRMEQLINLLADLGGQPQLLTTSEVQVAAANFKEKTVNVRLAVTGVTARKLVPEKLISQKKGPGL